MNTLTLFIPGVPKNANASSQWARFAAATDRKKFRTLARNIGNKVNIDSEWLPVHRTHITAWRVATVKRRRDALSLAEGLKGIIDGLVDAGLMPDDDEEHLGIILAQTLVSKTFTPGIYLKLEAVL